MLAKTEGANRNGQSSNTGNTGHKTQTDDKTRNTTRMNNKDPINKPRVNIWVTSCSMY